MEKTMQLNTLKPGTGSRQAKKRVGRGMGSGLGKTCGRGHKGQKSRSGGRIRPGFEGGQQPLQMRLPKFGFNSAKARITDEITLSELAKVEAEVVDLQSLIDADIIKGTMKRAKVILSGSIDKAVTVKGIKATKGAKAAIEAAGGKVEE
jgi:large subunit ribosomal protein L15